jgi:hypothetical protein
MSAAPKPRPALRPATWLTSTHPQVMASVTSSTHERKSKTNIVHKNGKIYLKHNAFT